VGGGKIFLKNSEGGTPLKNKKRNIGILIKKDGIKY
jgi:hypothetical protein